MKKQNLLDILLKIGESIAKEYGFDNIEIGEDRQKGMWGEKFTNYLEAKYGECTKEIHWYNLERTEYIEFRYRFASPCLCIRLSDGSLCEIEFGDYNPKTKQNDGNYTFTGMSVFESKGFELMDNIASKLYKFGIDIKRS